jgi:hypothetical protein
MEPLVTDWLRDASADCGERVAARSAKRTVPTPPSSRSSKALAHAALRSCVADLRQPPP